jgi:hypothetical protein
MNDEDLKEEEENIKNVALALFGGEQALSAHHRFDIYLRFTPPGSWFRRSRFPFP